MTRYRQLLAVPGLAALLSVSLLGRTAITAVGMSLTMYVVLGLHLSYAAAGGVTAALTAGLSLGGPLLGRAIDRRGARPVLLTTAGAQLLFWLAVPVLPIGVLVFAAFVAGLLMIPAPLVTRQAIAAKTTDGQRQAAFALESVQGELSYMVGPPLVILCAAKVSTAAVAWAVGAALVAGGAGIAVLNPPLRAKTQVAAHGVGRPRRREWLGPRMIAVLVMALGAAALLSATELAIVATLRAAGQVSWATVVVAVFAASSVVGGLVYGALVPPLPTWLLLALLGLATGSAGLAHDWRWLCVAGVGAGMLTAPTLSTVAATVSRLAPASVLGEATGLQSSALGAGFALGYPVAGMVIDAAGPGAGFVAAALVALVPAGIGGLLSRRSPTTRPRTLPSEIDLAGAPELEPCGVGAPAKL